VVVYLLTRRYKYERWEPLYKIIDSRDESEIDAIIDAAIARERKGNT